MKFAFQSLLFRLLFLLIVCPPSGFAFGQAQSGADTSSDDSIHSWTATTQQQLPNNLNPTRTSETHTQTGGRTSDNQSIQTMGTDGHYSPYLDVQKETVKVDANTVRTIERSFGRDADGRKTLVQVTEEEKRSLPGGEVKVTRSTSDPDGNGALKLVQREVQDVRQISPTVQETKSTLLTPSLNGGLTASMQTTERETKTSDHNVEFRKSTLLPDSNGNWQLNEVREGTIKDDGKNRTKEESVLRPGTDGNLSVVARTVSRESQNAAGEKRATVETYASDPGSGMDGLRLEQRVVTVHRQGDDGMQSTDQQVEQRNPGQPNDGLRVTEQAIDIVRPGTGGTTRETQTVRSLDSNGDLGVVSVDTRRQESAPAVQVDIAPTKK
ncbi:MAG TPA: hypothetical protein VK829_15245 [Terriglobales bacterium]|jgi:hypothetical protein|nr:hypothetical protein [Terriglobales bacterium]